MLLRKRHGTIICSPALLRSARASVSYARHWNQLHLLLQLFLLIRCQKLSIRTTHIRNLPRRWLCIAVRSSSNRRVDGRVWAKGAFITSDKFWVDIVGGLINGCIIAINNRIAICQLLTREDGTNLHVLFYPRYFYYLWTSIWTYKLSVFTVITPPVTQLKFTQFLKVILYG